MKDNDISSNEAELIDLLSFLQYAKKTSSSSSFTGTMCFEFIEKDNDLDVPFYYTVSVDECVEYTRHEIKPDMTRMDCHVICSMKDLLYMYSGTAPRSEIISMCTWGRIRVPGMKVRALAKFANSFEFSSEKWKGFYSQQKQKKEEERARNREQSSPINRIERGIFKQMPFEWSSIQNSKCTCEQRNNKNEERIQKWQRITETTSHCLLNSRCTLAHIHHQRTTLLDAWPWNSDSTTFATPTVLQPVHSNALDWMDLSTPLPVKNTSRRTRPFETVSNWLEKSKLLRRHTVGSSKVYRSGYSSTTALALREVQIQTNKLMKVLEPRKKKDPVASSINVDDIPLVWKPSKIKSPSPRRTSEHPVRDAILYNLNVDFKIRKQKIQKAVERLGGKQGFDVLRIEPDTGIILDF